MLRITVLVFVLFSLAFSAKIKIVSLYDKDLNDDQWDAWHDIARERVVAILTEMGVDVKSVIYTAVPTIASGKEDNAYTILRKHALEGFNISIVHNIIYADAMEKIAREFPEMRFITTPSVLRLTSDPAFLRTKSFSLYGKLWYAAYMAGRVCAEVSSTGNIGMIHYTTGGSFSNANAYFLGAKSINPNVNVFITPAADISSAIVDGKIASMYADDLNIDCMIGGAVAEAYTQMSKRQKFSIGLFGNTRFQRGETLLMQMKFIWLDLYRYAIDGYLNGTFPVGQEIWGDLGSGVDIADFSSYMPPHVLADVLTVREELMANETNLFCISQVPELAVMYPNYVNDCLTEQQIRTMNTWLPGLILPLGRFAENGSAIPMTRELAISYITISIGDGYSIGITVVSTITISLCIYLIGFIVKYRDAPVVKSASWEFMTLILVGCIVMVVGSFMWIVQPNHFICQARIWLWTYGFSISFGSALIKNIRIFMLYNNKSMEVYAIRTVSLLVALGAVLVLETVIPLAWSIAVPYTTATGEFSADLDYNEIVIACRSDNWIPLYVHLAVNGLLVACSIFIAFRNSKIRNNNYRESSNIANMLYALFFAGVMGVLVFTAVDFNIYSESVIITVVILLMVYGTIYAMFASRVYTVLWKGELISMRGSSRSTGINLNDVMGSSTAPFTTTSNDERSTTFGGSASHAMRNAPATPPPTPD